MSTDFAPLRNNSRGRVATIDALDSSNAMDTFDVGTGEGLDFEAGMFITVWDDLSFPSNPRADTGLRVGLITSVSGDTLTDVVWVDADGNPLVSPPNPTPGTPGVRGYILRAHFLAIYGAINDLEGAVDALEGAAFPLTDLPPSTIGSANAQGVSGQASRGDHVHEGVSAITADSTDLKGHVYIDPWDASIAIGHVGDHIVIAATGDGLVPDTRTINGHSLSSDVTVTKGDVGLGSADNTSDADKPVSDDTQDALDLKADWYSLVAQNVNNNQILLGPNMVNIPLYVRTTGSGNFDLAYPDGSAYTVPSGKRALFTIGMAYNDTGSSVTVFVGLKISGTYYKFSGSTTVNGSSVTNIQASVIAEAGEKFAIVASATGLNIWANVVEMDDTAPLKRASTIAPSSGDNTIYTCPGGKTARLIGNQAYGVYNGSGGARSITFYAVPAGGSPGSNSKFMLNPSLADGAASTGSLPIPFQAGDTIVFNTNAATATQVAWANLIEY